MDQTVVNIVLLALYETDGLPANREMKHARSGWRPINPHGYHHIVRPRAN